MIRMVVEREFIRRSRYRRKIRGRIVVTLSCGHEKSYPRNKAPLHHAHCTECDQSNQQKGVTHGGEE